MTEVISSSPFSTQFPSTSHQEVSPSLYSSSSSSSSSSLNTNNTFHFNQTQYPHNPRREGHHRTRPQRHPQYQHSRQPQPQQQQQPQHHQTNNQGGQTNRRNHHHHLHNHNQRNNQYQNTRFDQHKQPQKKVPTAKPTGAPKKPSSFVSSVFTDLANDIVTKLQTNSYECSICLRIVGKQTKMFSCKQCFALYHLSCVQTWSSTSMGDGTSWRCPLCQVAYLEKPTKYLCFCGKRENPEFDPYLIPHSCGETCGKMRDSKLNCPHPCGLGCHPGPCARCAALGERKYCYCKKTSYVPRCGEAINGKSCNNVCGKKLSCDQHFCDDICHEGDCKPCQVKVQQKCYCGKQLEDRGCGTGAIDLSHDDDGIGRYFSCEQNCGRKLRCGNHTCDDDCHMGDCKTCPTSPEVINRCPCGKSSLLDISKGVKRTSCLDPIPTCGEVCGKLLSCGLHTCKQKCHTGDCDLTPCHETVKVTCRCRMTTIDQQCHIAKRDGYQYLCKKVCKTTRSCGKHECNNRCCPVTADPTDAGGAHICRLTCGKKLNCGKHKCEALCHKGRCGNCPLAIFTELTCECGKTVNSNFPIPCNTPPPICSHECSRQRTCGHPPLHTCHTDECPPCAVLTLKGCSGGHGVMKMVPCLQNEVSCGRVCGLPLSCGDHKCARYCHSGPCVAFADLPPTPSSPSTTTSLTSTACNERRSCGRPCGRMRMLCEHGCQAVCHPFTDCPKVPCQQKTQIYCSCKRLSKTVICMRGGENPNQLVEESLPCDSQCEFILRNKKLTEAFYSCPNSEYDNGLIQAAKVSPTLLLRLEQMFMDLITSSSTSVVIPCTNKAQRRLVVEYSKHFGLDINTHDLDLNRTIRVSKSKMSAKPSMLLSAVLQSQQSQNRRSSADIHAIHFYDLNADIKTHHLTSFLYSFVDLFEIFWLDDKNALAVFKNENIMLEAFRTLQGGIFKVKIYASSTTGF